MVQRADDILAEVYRGTLDGTDPVVAFHRAGGQDPSGAHQHHPRGGGLQRSGQPLRGHPSRHPRPFQARFVDSEPGYQRGTVFRLTPTALWNPALGYRLRIPATCMKYPSLVCACIVEPDTCCAAPERCE